jgi:hypothetical protein
VARNANIVFAATPDEAGLLEGLRGGHLVVLAGPRAARVYLEADARGDGSFTAIMGDTVPRPAAGTLAVRAHELGGDGKQVVFYTARGRVGVLRVHGVEATVTFTAKLAAAGPDFVRCELRDHPNLPWSMTAIGNPTYVADPGR